MTRRQRRLGWTCGLVLGLLLTATQSHAFWSAASTPGSAGGASATTVPAGATPQVTRQGNDDLRVAWSATTLRDGTTATGYTLTRYAASGAAHTVTGGCAGTVGGTSCTETDVPDGLWTYAVTPRYHSWSGATGARSTEIRTDATPPSNDIDRVAVSGGSVRVGADLFYYRGAAAGSLHLRNAVRDAGSGPASSATGALTGSSAGWTHTPSTVSTPTGGPYPSTLFSWAAGTTSEPRVVVTGRDAVGNATQATRTFQLDNTPPTGGAIDYPDGAQASTAVPVTTGAVADARAGVASKILETSSAALDDLTCGSFGDWSTITQNPEPTHTFSGLVGRCYRFRYVVGDAVGNQLVSTSPKVVKVSRSYPAVVRGTPGLTNYWRMNDSGATIAPTVGAVSGSYGGGAFQQQEGAIAGDQNRSVWFDGVDDFGRVSRTVGNDFSAEFWFRTNIGLGDGANWWQGAGMVDAEVPGVADDFGVSLMADGRVGAGVGNPDRTVFSPGGFHDNVWHHVVMTRAQGTGRVELYVDGQLRGATAGNTRPLTASANIDFGRLQTGVNHYRGNLDEIALYNRVLPGATVLDHYRTGLP